MSKQKIEKVKFIKAKSQKDAQRQAPNYKCFVKCKGGYMAYLTVQDFFITWQSMTPQCEYIY